MERDCSRNCFDEPTLLEMTKRNGKPRVALSTSRCKSVEVDDSSCLFHLYFSCFAGVNGITHSLCVGGGLRDVWETAR